MPSAELEKAMPRTKQPHIYDLDGTTTGFTINFALPHVIDKVIKPTTNKLINTNVSSSSMSSINNHAVLPQFTLWCRLVYCNHSFKGYVWDFIEKVAYDEEGSRTSSVRVTLCPTYCPTTHLCPLAKSLRRLGIPVVCRTCRFPSACFNWNLNYLIYISH
jgi:hypothetical protein